MVKQETGASHPVSFRRALQITIEKKQVFFTALFKLLHKIEEANRFNSSECHILGDH